MGMIGCTAVVRMRVMERYCSARVPGTTGLCATYRRNGIKRTYTIETQLLLSLPSSVYRVPRQDRTDVDLGSSLAIILMKRLDGAHMRSE